MKFIYAILFSLSFCAVGYAQEKSLSVDERGKLIHYEVVSVKELVKDSLFKRAEAFLTKDAKKFTLKSTSADTALQAMGKMMISKSAVGMARPTGEVSYNFYMQIKADKYRFWLTDFVFVPYVRDRYANFVPATAKGFSLDADPGKLSAGDWASYKKLTAREAAKLAEEFKKALATPLTKSGSAKKNTVSTKEW